MRVRPQQYTGVTATPTTDQPFEFGRPGVLVGFRGGAVNASGTDISHNVAVRIRRPAGEPVLQDWTPLNLFADPRSLALIDFGEQVTESATWRVDLQVIQGGDTAVVTLAAVLA